MNCYLIDDDKVFHLISHKMLQRSGIEVAVSNFFDGEEALASLKKSIEQQEVIPQIILLDIRMPKMDGFTFLDEYAKLPEEVTNHIKIFLLTSSIDKNDIERAKNHPALKGFFNKPLSFEAIKTIIGQD
jgi:CheY-like chemotaxis protein